MTTITHVALLFLAVAVLLAWWVWNQREQDVDDGEDAAANDARITPLLRGINYLLSDQADLALQEMVQVARLRSDAIDVYMALGEMFRSSGEIGRAVRIHQNLLARPDISSDGRLQAHFALGRDFHTGGLLDRALRQYDHALGIQSDHLPSLEASLRIREQSREWLPAEELLCRIERIRGEESHFHRASLYAEEARRCWRDDHHPEEAEDFANRAIGLDAACAAAYLVQLDLLIAQTAPWQAIEDRFTLLWQQCRHHAAQAIPSWIGHDAYREASTTLLLRCWHDGHDEQLMLLWLEQLYAAGCGSRVKEIVMESEFVPVSLRGEMRLLALREEGDADSQRLAERARVWRKQVKDYRCHECGVEVREMRWQCPQCHQWGSIRAQEGGGL
ncbi:MAG: heat-shock protein [Mariprofundales bacterium]|nr:heat-shock protein [Mariprofundales bacterium]